ncbi:MAG: 1-acyl-sn-glycerol-3-phosphate acyltransferase [Rhizobiaceae bacterium]|jgi:1-acyl-sn-glycerol-3-phosphate acyltransferase|nr:1-acyl-sn-glycerol-3-phosphate acyltransferase [Rhizobiaceae bacterium]
MPAAFRIAIIVLAAFAVTLALLPLHVGGLALRHRLRGLIPVWWHRSICRLMRLRVTVSGEMAAGRPLLLVANHVSWKDITVLGSVAPLAFIAKGEVRDWPLFGWLARLQRTVFIDRNDRRKAGAQAHEIATRLAHEGDVMVLFAEGTTGDGTRLLPFKSSLVGAAEKAVAGEGGGVIQPVAILYARSGGMPAGYARRLAAAWIGDTELIPHLRQMLTAPPMDAEVMFGPPVTVGPGFDRKAVTRQLEATIARMLFNRLGGRAFDAEGPNPAAAG